MTFYLFCVLAFLWIDVCVHRFSRTMQLRYLIDADVNSWNHKNEKQKRHKKMIPFSEVFPTEII